jgi:Lon protease-like protein
MQEPTHIPLFPLTLLPLPGELVPLHIFEPRYKQLLQDAETLDMSFGIYCNHELNKEKLGSLMKLESTIKRYPTGEADIVVRCIDVFTLDKMFRNHKLKMYPGGEVQLWQTDTNEMPGAELYEDFLEYQRKRNIHNHLSLFNLYQIGVELNFDLFDRYRFLTSSYEKKLLFLSAQLKFQLHILNQEEKSKDLFHLN